MGEGLHYEYHNGKVHLHIKGSNWRPIRNYFDSVLSDPCIIAEHWWRQRCCLTLQRVLSSWEELQEASLEIDRTMRPHTQSFERSQGVYQMANLSLTGLKHTSRYTKEFLCSLILHN